jgi:hypothetical protein
MANNKKKTVTTRRDKKQQDEASPADGASANMNIPSDETKAEWFTNSQLASVIFLTFGLSKILEIHAAVKQGSTDPKLCMAYLNSEETCTNENFPSLILAKYYSSIQVAGLVLSLCYHAWNQEFYFRKLITLLSFTPLATTFITCGLNYKYLDPTKGRTLMMIVFILLGVAIPNSKAMLPFTASDRPLDIKSMPGMCLMMLASIAMMEVGQVWSRSGDVGGLENALLAVDGGAAFPEPAKVLVALWLVDKMTMAFLFAYALIDFPEADQKVSRPREYECIYYSMMSACVYYYLLTTYAFKSSSSSSSDILLDSCNAQTW